MTLPPSPSPPSSFFGTLASGGGEWNRPGDVILWDLDAEKEIASLKHTSEVLCVAVSRDGKRLAAGSGDHTATVWDAVSGLELLTLRGHRGSVNSVAWSPDGKRLAIIAARDQAGVVHDKVVFVFNFFEYLWKIAPGKK